MSLERNLPVEILYQPIPLDIKPVSGWKNIPIAESGESLVPLGVCSNYSNIFTDSVYFGERNDSPYTGINILKESLVTCFVREGVAKQLSYAQGLLPRGHHLIIYDTYRPLEVQQALYNKYIGALEQMHPDWNQEEVEIETQKYVSLPSNDFLKPSPHNTGGAVDLAIVKFTPDVEIRIDNIDSYLVDDSQRGLSRFNLQMQRNRLIVEKGIMLDFGTPFDYGGHEASINYFETLATNRLLNPVERAAQLNRRLLYNIMTTVGFHAYQDEWWHFNSKKTQMGAKTANIPIAEYGAISLSDSNIVHESMRRKYANRLLRLQKATCGRRELSPKLKAAVTIFEKTALECGDIKASNLPLAQIITPIV